MRIFVQNNLRKVAELAYQFVKSAIVDKGSKVLGFASGSTMLDLYAELASGCRRGDLDFSDVSTFNVGEYLGLPPDHPQSCRFFMEANLFGHLNLKSSNIHFLDGLTDSVEDECAYYEQDMEALGGVKLQLLGLGRNGHLGFNEPGTPMESRSHYATLTEETREDNRRFFPAKVDVPRWALTMGTGTILDAQELLLIATGQEKAIAVRDMVEGPVSASCPASFLQVHPNANVILDEAAASLLARKSYWNASADDYNDMMDYLMAARRKAGLE